MATATESTAVSDNVSLGSFVTAGPYPSYKGGERRAWVAYQNAINTATTDEASYFTALQNYINNETPTNNASVVSALATWQSAVAAVETTRQSWIAQGTGVFEALA
jgi:hypothetical protein